MCLLTRWRRSKRVCADEAGVLKRMEDALAYMARVNAEYSDEEIEADLKEATHIIDGV